MMTLLDKLPRNGSGRIQSRGSGRILSSYLINIHKLGLRRSRIRTFCTLHPRGQPCPDVAYT